MCQYPFKKDTWVISVVYSTLRTFIDLLDLVIRWALGDWGDSVITWSDSKHTALSGEQGLQDKFLYRYGAHRCGVHRYGTHRCGTYRYEYEQSKLAIMLFAMYLPHLMRIVVL